MDPPTGLVNQSVPLREIETAAVGDEKILPNIICDQGKDRGSQHGKNRQHPSTRQARLLDGGRDRMHSVGCYSRNFGNFRFHNPNHVIFNNSQPWLKREILVSP